MIRNSINNGISEIAILLSSLIASLILSRTLGPEVWGQYNQVLWLVGITSILLSFGLMYTVLRFSAYAEGKQDYPLLLKILRPVYMVEITAACLGAGFFTLNADLIRTWLGWSIPTQVIRLAGFGVLVIMLFHLASATLRGLQLFKWLAIFSLIQAVLLLVGVATTLHIPSLTTLLISIYAAQGIVCLGMIGVSARYFKTRSAQQARPTTIAWQAIARYSLLIYLTMLVDQIVWQKSELFFLGRLPGAAESGYYGLAYTIAMVALGTVPGALTGILTPTFTNQFSSLGSEQVQISFRQAFSYLNWILMPALAGLVVLAPALISDLYGSPYLPAAPVLRILAVSTAIAIYTRPSASVLHAVNRPKILFLCSLLALPMDLILAWRLVPAYGAVGAALANLVAQSAAGFSAMAFVTLKLRYGYEWRALWCSLLASCGCGLTAWLGLMITQQAFTRLFLATFSGTAAYIGLLLMLKDVPTQAILAKAKSMLVSYQKPVKLRDDREDLAAQ